jgi:hypothetical protein
MRAREFTINVPITIKINGDDDPEIEMDNLPDPDSKQDVMMSPQQQELELRKAELGKPTVASQKLLEPPEPGEIT